MAGRLASIDDYAGRQVDLLFLQDEQYDGRAPVRQSLLCGDGRALLTTGTQKLVQRFLLELLTEQGSLAFRPDAGSLFMTAARSGGWRTAADVEQAFYGSLLHIRRHLLAEEEPNDPPDERFAGAELLASSIDGDRVVLRIQVSSRAGRSEFLFPLAVNVVD